MDKLNPILAQKFWILSGLCLFLPLFGWWWDSAAMSKEITDRTDKIKKAFDGVPGPGPNKQWSDQVELKNKEEELKVTKTGDQLWEALIPYMTWPERMTDVVAKAGYRGVIDPTTRGEYRDLYEKEIVDLPKIVTPFNPLDSKGMVQLPDGLILGENLGMLEVAPSDKVTWDAQEDIWLYKTLLEAVQRTNERAGADSLLNAVIKQIDVLMLRGGSPKTPGGSGSATASAAPAMAGPSPGGHMALPPGPGNMAGGDSARGGAGGSGGMSASFDPAEEFGSDEDTSGGAGGATSGTAPVAPMGPMGPMGQHSGPLGATGGAFGNADVPRKRYIEETKRYKTRGFYMEVVMDHRKLPEFLAELSDSPWPLKVVRVQQVDKDLQDVGSTSVGGVAMSGMTSAGGSKSMMAGPPGGHGGGAAAKSSAPLMKTPRFGNADDEDRPSRRSTIPTPGRPSTSGFAVESGENIIDPTAVLADPNLVNVAVAGIITIYLPPEVAAVVPGAPGTAAPGTPATGTPTVPGAPTAAGTPTAPGAQTVPDASVTTVPAATGAAVPATGSTPPAGPAAGTGEPTAVPATGSPATAPANTPAPMESKAAEPTPPATATPPAGATTPAQTPPTSPVPGTEKK